MMRRTILASVFLLFAPSLLLSQHEEHEHEHGGLHFSHPLVTESPSPDTKLRVDYLWERAGSDPFRVTARGARVEGEYAFSPALSLALTVPWTSVSVPGFARVSGIGNTELSLKAASTRWGEHGLLVGGGLSTGLPTGDDEKGIGTSRAVELEPFADVALKRGALELVAFGHVNTTVRNPAGVDAEREAAFDFSALHPLGSRVEALVEFNAAKPLAGDDRSTATSFAPGVKLYPFRQRALMVGVSAPIGLGGPTADSRAVIVSAFYHF